MNDLILLLSRHLLVVLGAFLAAHGIHDVTTTQGIVAGVALLFVSAVWSFIVKMLKFDPLWHFKPALADALKTALGSIISQGITFLSVYLATDASDPEKLLPALINIIASRYGVHQQLVHQTPIATATAIKALALGSLLMLSSCANTLAWFATPAGQATVSLAELGLDVAAAKGKISPGQVVNVKQGIAVVTDPSDSTVSKVFKLEELGLKAAVQTGKLQPGDAVIIQAASAIVQSAVTPPVQPSGKAPASVLPAS